MRFVTILKGTAILSLMIVLTVAQTPLIESFNYGAGSSINGKGSAGEGWSTGWVFDTSSAVDVGAITEEGFVYDDLNYDVFNVGNHLQLNMPGGWQDVKYDRLLSETWPDEAGKEYWMSLLFQTSTAPTGNTYYITKLFNDDSEIIAIGKSGGGTQISCGSGWAGGAGDDVSDMECVGDPVWLVTKIVCSGGGDSRTYMWIDPDPEGGAPDTSYADVKRNTNLQGGINKVKIECGGEDSLVVFFDEIRLGTSFEEVAEAVEITVEMKVQESFAYSAGGSLDGKGSTGDGWSTGWVFDTSSAVDVGAITEEGFVYDDLNYDIPNVGNHLTLNMPGGWQDVKYDRFLSETWPDEAGKEYWMSLLFQTSTAPTGNTYYITKLFNDDSEIIAIGKSGGGTQISCGSGWAGGAGDDVSATECVGDPVWLVTKIVCSGGGDSRTYMWIDPDPEGGAPDTSYADVKRNTNLQGGINKVKIECGGEDSLSVYFDEIRLGTAFEEVAATFTVIDEKKGEILASNFALNQNYPNPFNPTTTITYSLQNSDNVRLAVYNMLGEEVEILVNKMQRSGAYKVNFSGENLSSGIYFYRLMTGSGNITKKMMLIK